MPDPSSATTPPIAVGAATITCTRSVTRSTDSIAVRGQLDADAVSRLGALLRETQAGAATVVLDLRELEFIDSSAARLILRADRRARRAGGRLIVVRGPEAAWFLALAGIDQLLELVDEPPRDVPLKRSWHGLPA